jgi:hypothetical protein
MALISSSALAGDVKMKSTWDGQDAAGNGGPFTAQMWDHASNTGVGNPWMTYCVEGNEFFSNNGQYWKEISTSAKGGGLTGQNLLGVDELSTGSAWLFRQTYDAVMRGSSNALASLTWDDAANISHTFDASDVAGDLSEIQRVIWSFEGEGGAGGPLDTYRFDAIVQLVKNNVGAADYLKDGAIYGLYGVRVMRLWQNQNRTGAGQDQLIVIPLPAPIAMSTAGLLGLAVIRRRRA